MFQWSKHLFLSPCLFFGQQCLDGAGHLTRLRLGAEPTHRRPLVIHQELDEVPPNVSGAVVPGQPSFQERVDLARFLPVHVALFEPGELVLRPRPEFSLDEVHDFVVGTRFLTPELIAREGQDFEPPRAVLVEELGELDVVRFGQTSLRRDVDHAQNVALELAHRDLVAVHLPVDEIVERVFIRARFLAEREARDAVLNGREYGAPFPHG